MRSFRCASQRTSRRRARHWWMSASARRRRGSQNARSRTSSERKVKVGEEAKSPSVGGARSVAMRYSRSRSVESPDARKIVRYQATECGEIGIMSVASTRSAQAVFQPLYWREIRGVCEQDGDSLAKGSEPLHDAQMGALAAGERPAAISAVR